MVQARNHGERSGVAGFFRSHSLERLQKFRNLQFDAAHADTDGQTLTVEGIGGEAQVQDPMQADDRKDCSASLNSQNHVQDPQAFP